MLSEKLRQNFRKRVQSERRVLDLVNSSGKFNVELVGLNEKVLVNWAVAADVNPDLKDILNKISVRLRLDHCVSNELFPGESYDGLEDVTKLLQILTDKVSCS